MSNLEYKMTSTRNAYLHRFPLIEILIAILSSKSFLSLGDLHFDHRIHDPLHTKFVEKYNSDSLRSGSNWKQRLNIPRPEIIGKFDIEIEICFCINI